MMSTANDNQCCCSQISVTEAAYFKGRYQKMFESYHLFRELDNHVSKKSKGYVNDILAEKIALEKARMREAEEVSMLRRHEEQRNFMQKELESTEQRDTTAKFELSELKRVYEEYTIALSNMQRDNVNLVSPIIKKLEQDVSTVFFAREFVMTNRLYLVFVLWARLRT